MVSKNVLVPGAQKSTFENESGNYGTHVNNSLWAVTSFRIMPQYQNDILLCCSYNHSYLIQRILGSLKAPNARNNIKENQNDLPRAIYLERLNDGFLSYSVAISKPSWMCDVITEQLAKRAEGLLMRQFFGTWSLWLGGSEEEI